MCKKNSGVVILGVLMIFFIIFSQFISLVGISKAQASFEGKLIRWHDEKFYWYVDDGKRLVAANSSSVYWDKVIESHGLNKGNAIWVGDDVISSIPLGKNLTVAPNKGYVLTIGDASYIVVEEEKIMKIDEEDYLDANGYLGKYSAELLFKPNYEEIDFDKTKDLFDGEYDTNELFEKDTQDTRATFSKLKASLLNWRFDVMDQFDLTHFVDICEESSASLDECIFSFGYPLHLYYMKVNNTLDGDGFDLVNSKAFAKERFDYLVDNLHVDDEDVSDNYEFKGADELKVFLNSTGRYKLYFLIDNNIVAAKLVSASIEKDYKEVFEYIQKFVDKINIVNNREVEDEIDVKEDVLEVDDEVVEVIDVVEVVEEEEEDENSEEKNIKEIAVAKRIMVKNKNMYARLKGNIMLKVEDKGMAYYVHPKSEELHFLGRPSDAFSVMREQGVGIKNSDLYKIPVGVRGGDQDTDNDGISDNLEKALGLNFESKDTDNDGYDDKAELTAGFNPWGAGRQETDSTFAGKQKGLILLQVEKNGEAWYVNPSDGKRYFLGRPQDAFNVMRTLGLGITNSDFDSI